MDWVKDFNLAIDYIEENLEENISVQSVADAAFSSLTHFQRIFFILTGITITDYIRNRRLSFAAIDLLNGMKVIDVAFKYQYESSESFSRAFKKFHGFSPSSISKDKSIRSYQKLVIKIKIEGEIEMKYRIETKDAMKFIGVRRTFNIENGENFIEIPKFWQEVMQNGTFDQIMEHSKSDQCLGVCMPMNEDNTSFDYIIGAFSSKANSDFESFEAKEYEYAVFELTGPMSKTLQDAWKRIFSEWFPVTNYKPANAPQFEVYMGGDVEGENYYMEIWIPITTT